MTAKTRITAERLREVLSYDPETGLFVSVLLRKGAPPVGEICGGPNADGYIQLTIDGVFYLGHVLAWFWMTGEWPDRKIDHKNLMKGDNSWNNLRKATNSQNCFNRPIQTNNKSGFKGVAFFKGDKYPRKKPWCAEISAYGKRVWMAYFATPEEAAAARAIAVKQFHGEFSKSL